MSTWASSDNLITDNATYGSAFEGADDLTPERNKILKAQIIDRGLACASGGNIYIFMTSINQWTVASSAQAVVFLNSNMKMESATVNYSNAFTPYIEYLERYAINNIALPMPTSICIGSRRLRVSISGSTLHFAECEALVTQLDNQQMKMPSRLCYMSLALPMWLKEWKRSSDFKLYRFIRPFIADETDMKTLEWIVGNTLVDPVAFNKALILYGPGGRGKSTILTAIDIALSGCTGSIPNSTLLSMTGYLTDSVASTIISKRLVTAGDVGQEGKVSNLTIIKSITGNDFITIGPSRARTSCSIIYASNTLDDPKLNKEWSELSIARRVVVLNIDTFMKDVNTANIPQGPIDRCDFALRCVHTRMSNNLMPISYTSILLSIMGSQYKTLSNYLVPVDKDELDTDEIMEVNTFIAVNIGANSMMIGELAYVRNPAWTVTIAGTKYLTGVGFSTLYDTTFN